MFGPLTLSGHFSITSFADPEWPSSPVQFQVRACLTAAAHPERIELVDTISSRRPAVTTASLSLPGAIRGFKPVLQSVGRKRYM